MAGPIVRIELRFLDPRDRKRRRLERTLKISRHEAIGLCVDFWGFCCDHTDENGCLTAKPDAIDEYIETEGAYPALKQCGFIDPDGVTVHDWFEENHTGQYFRYCREQAKAQKARRDRYKEGGADGGRSKPAGGGDPYSSLIPGHAGHAATGGDVRAGSEDGGESA